MDIHMKTNLWRTISFFAFAYIWSWSWWIPVVLTLHTDGGAFQNYIPGWIVPFVLIGAYGPSISAIVITVFTSGRNGLKSLLSQFFRWRAPVIVHIMIWLGPSIFVIVAMIIAPRTTASLGQINWSQLQIIPMVLLSGLIFGPLAEELGWRGFALPTLQKSNSALKSSLIIGVLWCFWHTPLFWAPGGTLISGQEITIIGIGKYLLYAIGLAIIFTWIYNNSKGSVLLSVAFHAIVNASLPLLLFPAASANSSKMINSISMIPTWIVVIILIVIYGSKNLSKKSRVV